MPFMRRLASAKFFFFFLFFLLRVVRTFSRAASVAILPSQSCLSDSRSLQGGPTQSSRCSDLTIDLAPIF
jgi:hypothetical protein